MTYLRSLPATASVTHAGTAYLLVHGSPRNPLTGGIGPEGGDGSVREALAGCSEACILCAHTHVPMFRRLDGKLLANTGSVGQPRDGDPRAQCMIIRDDRIHFERVTYDLDALEYDYRRSALPVEIQEEWIRYARQGYVDPHGLRADPFASRSNVSAPCPCA